jgi:hypothetical protein
LCIVFIFLLIQNIELKVKVKTTKKKEYTNSLLVQIENILSFNSIVAVIEKLIIEIIKVITGIILVKNPS